MAVAVAAGRYVAEDVRAGPGGSDEVLLEADYFLDAGREAVAALTHAHLDQDDAAG